MAGEDQAARKARLVLQGAAHGNVRAAAALCAAFTRPHVAAFASPRSGAARRSQKTLIRLFLRGRSSLRPRCVELARVRPGASMRACPGDIFGTFMARGACVPLFQRRQMRPQSVLANVSFLFSIERVVWRAWGAWYERRVRHARARVGLVCWNQFCLSCVRIAGQDFNFLKPRIAIGHRHRSAQAPGSLPAVRRRRGANWGGSRAAAAREDPARSGRLAADYAGVRQVGRARVASDGGPMSPPRRATSETDGGKVLLRETACAWCVLFVPIRPACPAFSVALSASASPNFHVFV